MWFHTRLYTSSILPEQQYTFHKKYTRLHIEYREDKIVALGSRQVNDYVAALTSEKTEIRRVQAQSEKAWKRNPEIEILICNSLEEQHKSPQRRGKKMCSISQMYLQDF